LALAESLTIQKARDGDKEALAELVNMHKELAFNIAYRITKNVEDAEDIVQESFLKVFKNLDRFKEASKFSSWLYRIVHNEGLMLVRKQKKSLEFLDAPMVENIEEAREHSDDYKKLYEAIDQLSINERNLIDLFYLGDMSIKEIRKITGQSTSNIKVTLHRTRKKLQEKIKNG